MSKEALNITLLYISDCALVLFFIIGLATAIEYFAKRALSRILLALTPRQIAKALFAQLAIILLALVGFKFIVLQGGPGVNTKKILSSSNLTQGYSLVALSLGFSLAAIGLVRLLRILLRHAVLVRF